MMIEKMKSRIHLQSYFTIQGVSNSIMQMYSTVEKIRSKRELHDRAKLKR